MIEHWILNALIITLPFSWYMTYQFWKDDRKRRKFTDDLIDKYCKLLENKKL